MVSEIVVIVKSLVRSWELVDIVKKTLEFGAREWSREKSDDQEDSLTSTTMLVSRAITQFYSTPTNNQLRTSSNTMNQAVVQADRVNIQRKNVRNGGRIARRSYNTQEESAENINVQKETGNDSKYFIKQILYAKKDKAEHNDFLLADADQMEEIKKLSVNICMMARIQQATTDSDEGPSYDSRFISEVQTPSTSFMNSLFFNSYHEQTYHEQPEIVNSTNDDQINSDIIFDDPNVEVNNDTVGHDKHVHDSYELE
ncbi:hypothetical protein Tco_1189640 [Tanacetum coccineum]